MHLVTLVLVLLLPEWIKSNPSNCFPLNWRSTQYGERGTISGVYFTTDTIETESFLNKDKWNSFKLINEIIYFVPVWVYDWVCVSLYGNYINFIIHATIFIAMTHCNYDYAVSESNWFLNAISWNENENENEEFFTKCKMAFQ